ncbi:uncharacterized protein A1O9_06744, partial [Exophiala aquamarina CBS 119918]
GAFVLMGGRLGMIFGHKKIVLIAGPLWVLFCLISGFMWNFIALCVMRGLTGIGGAFIVPNSIALNYPVSTRSHEKYYRQHVRCIGPDWSCRRKCSSWFLGTVAALEV